MKSFYLKYKKQILVLLTIFSPFQWYLIGLLCGGGTGIIFVGTFSAILQTVYFGIKAAHLEGIKLD